MDRQELALVEDPSSELIEFGHLGEDQERTPAHTYPEPDRGKHAWLFLWVGCFLMIALTWGFPFSYGVFQSYLSSHPPFSDHPEGLPAVGTTALVRGHSIRRNNSTPIRLSLQTPNVDP